MLNSRYNLVYKTYKKILKCNKIHFEQIYQLIFILIKFYRKLDYFVINNRSLQKNKVVFF